MNHDAAALGVSPLPPRLADWKGTERYQVRRCIGAGTMGTVYEAFDRERGQSVALKKLRHFPARPRCTSSSKSFPDAGRRRTPEPRAPARARGYRGPGRVFHDGARAGQGVLGARARPRADGLRAASSDASSARRWSPGPPCRRQAAPRHKAVQRARHAGGARGPPRFRGRHRPPSSGRRGLARG